MFFPSDFRVWRRGASNDKMLVQVRYIFQRSSAVKLCVLHAQIACENTQHAEKKTDLHILDFVLRDFR